MDDRTELDPLEGDVAAEEERRGVPRTTTTGEAETDVRQPGDGAVTDLRQPGSVHDPDLPEEIRRGPRRPPPTGRTPVDLDPDRPPSDQER